ncbi:MAG: energy transducer TonB [Sulfurimonas sp.]|jgi:TonB family protein
MKKIIIGLSIFSIILSAGIKEDIAKDNEIKKQENKIVENIKLIDEMKSKYFHEFCRTVYISASIDFSKNCENKTYTKDELEKFYNDADKLPENINQIESNYFKELKDFFTKTVSKDNRIKYKELLIDESIVNNDGTILPYLPDVKNGLHQYKEIIKSKYRHDSPNSGSEFLNAHLGEIRGLLLQNFRYPKEAQKRKMQGKVKVSFLLSSDGSVDNIKVVESSGFEVLDDDAVYLIERTASTFPKPTKSVRITVPLEYIP